MSSLSDDPTTSQEQMWDTKDGSGSEDKLVPAGLTSNHDKAMIFDAFVRSLSVSK